MSHVTGMPVIRLVLLSLTAWTVALLSSDAWAHGDLHERIAALSARLAREPAEAPLHLKRGRLHHAHGDWAAALRDFDRAAELDPTLADVTLFRGLTLLDSGDPRAARAMLDRFLATHPDDVVARVARARALVRAGDPVAAADDFTRAIAQRPEVDYYLERAQALRSAGGAHLDEALRGLDAGIAKLGPLVSLQLPAIELELEQRRVDAALARLDALAATTRRQEHWLARRAEILEQAGRHREAESAVARALAAMDSLPPHRRHTHTMRELEGALRAALHRLRSEGSPTP